MNPPDIRTWVSRTVWDGISPGPTLETAFHAGGPEKRTEKSNEPFDDDRSSSRRWQHVECVAPGFLFSSSSRRGKIRILFFI